MAIFFYMFGLLSFVGILEYFGLVRRLFVFYFYEQGHVVNFFVSVGNSWSNRLLIKINLIMIKRPEFLTLYPESSLLTEPSYLGIIRELMSLEY